MMDVTMIDVTMMVAIVDAIVDAIAIVIIPVKKCNDRVQ